MNIKNRSVLFLCNSSRSCNVAKWCCNDFSSFSFLIIWRIYFSVYFIFISFVIFCVHGLGDIMTEKYNEGLLVGMYFLILPNLAMSGFGSIMRIAHLWSIGVEEQFCLMWPLILKYLKNKFIIL